MMSLFKNCILSLVTSSVLLGGIVYFGQKTLKPKLENHFYVQPKLADELLFVEKLNEGCNSYIQNILTTLEKETPETIVPVFPKYHDSSDAHNLKNQLALVLPGLIGIRVVDRNFNEIYFSTFDFDVSYKKGSSGYKKYREIEQKACEIPEHYFSQENESEDISKWNILFDKDNSRFLIFSDISANENSTANGLNGKVIFYFGLNGLESYLKKYLLDSAIIPESSKSSFDSFALIKLIKSINAINSDSLIEKKSTIEKQMMILAKKTDLSGGLVFGIKNASAVLENHIFGEWDKTQDSSSVSDKSEINFRIDELEYMGQDYFLLTANDQKYIKSAVFYDKKDLELPVKVYYEILGVVLTALFLIFLICFSFIGLKRKKRLQKKRWKEQRGGKSLRNKATPLTSNDYLEELDLPVNYNVAEIVEDLEEIESCKNNNVEYVIDDDEADTDNGFECNVVNLLVEDNFKDYSDITQEQSISELEEVAELEELTDEELDEEELTDEELVDDIEELEELEELKESDESGELDESAAIKNVKTEIPKVPEFLKGLQPKPIYSKDSNKTFISATSDNFPNVNNVFAEDLCIGDEYIAKISKNNKTSEFVASPLDFVPVSAVKNESISDLEELEEINEPSSVKDTVLSENPYFTMTTFGQNQEVISDLEDDTIIETEGVYSISDTLAYLDVIQDPDFKALVDSVLK